MSLINDALKRASQSQRQASSQAPIDAPMQPAQAAARRSVLPLLLCFAVILLLACVVVLFLHFTKPTQVAKPAPTFVAKVKVQPAKTEEKTAATPPTAVASSPPAANPKPLPVVTPTPPPPPAQTNTPAPSPVHQETAPSAPPAAPVQVPAPVQTPTPPQASAPSIELPPARTLAAPSSATPRPVAVAQPFPNLRLAAIVYSEANPMALINNRTLAVGEQIESARVVKIEPRKVTVEWHGQSKELFLGGD